jgi:uncharacterized coiled-coil protein SlyX
MVKKLMLLGVMIISSLSLFSQNVTPTQEFIKIPVPTVRKIVVDLVKGDSAIAQLEQSNLMVTELEKKTTLQDNLITNYKQIDANNKIIITNLERKVDVVEKEFKTVAKELKRQKVKSKITNLAGSAVILTLTFFLITK